MKMLNSLNAVKGRGRRSTVAALLLGGTVAAISSQSLAQSSPVGTVWDCVISGPGQRGIAFLTFETDTYQTNWTFSGYQILSTSLRHDTDEVEARNPGGDIGRDFEVDTPNGKTNLFGFDQFSGPWRYDSKGQVIGSFYQVASPDQGNVDGLTNSISFVAKVVPGKRLTLVASTSTGKVTYKGVPYVQSQPSLNGEWYGDKTVKGQTFTEFFSLTSTADSNPFPENEDLSNYPGIYYTENGQGPGYQSLGFALLSSQKKIAFAFLSYAAGGTNAALNASFGNFSSSKGVLKAKTSGVEDPGQNIKYTFMQPFGSSE